MEELFGASWLGLDVSKKIFLKNSAYKKSKLINK